MRDLLGQAEPPRPDLLQIVDALILYDTPLLDHRFEQAVAMHPDASVRDALARLPALVAEGSRLTRRGAVTWEGTLAGRDLGPRFRLRAERFLLEAYLDAAEAQIRLKTFMAREAPTAEVRAFIDDAILIHRELAQVLRDALQRLETVEEVEERPRDAVGVPAPTGELRTAVEAAIRRMNADGKGARTVVVGPNAQRRLRDEGLFRDGEARILGVPVQVDFAWSHAEFAVLSFDSVPLEEIQGAGDEAQDASRKA